jgi:chaperonin GroES
MFRPLHNRLVVERMEPEQTTASGIIIPDTAKEKPQQGKVKSVGPGNRDKDGKIIPMEIKAGDVVLFSKYGGADITLDGKEYLILKDEDVLGVIEHAKAGGKKGK